MADFVFVAGTKRQMHNAAVADVATADPTGEKAQGTLTIAEPVTDGDEFTLDAKVYTLQATLTDVDGNIAIGGSEAQTKLNIIAAIMGTGTPGTDYATSMTVPHPTMSGAAFSGDDAILTALLAGIAGDALVTAETGQGFTHASNIFDGATLGAVTAGLDVSWSAAEATLLTEVKDQLNLLLAAARLSGQILE